jgi:hypothetical protein
MFFSLVCCGESASLQDLQADDPGFYQSILLMAYIFIPCAALPALIFISTVAKYATDFIRLLLDRATPSPELV